MFYLIYGYKLYMKHCHTLTNAVIGQSVVKEYEFYFNWKLRIGNMENGQLKGLHTDVLMCIDYLYIPAPSEFAVFILIYEQAVYMKTWILIACEIIMIT